LVNKINNIYLMIEKKQKYAVATAWHDGHPNSNTGAGYGLRILKEYCQKIVSNENEVILHLEGESSPVRIPLSNSAKYGNCCELRSKYIGMWLIKNEYKKWEHGNPPRFDFILRERNNVFDVKLPQ